MRLVTYRTNGEQRIGAFVNDDRSIVDFAAFAAKADGSAPEWSRDMLALIDGGDAALDAARSLVDKALGGTFGELVDTDTVELMAPVPVPRQIRDCLSFEKHFRQAREGRLRAIVDKAEDKVAAEKELRASGRFEIPQVWYDMPLYYKCNRFSVVGTGTDLIMPSYSKEMDYELEFGVFLKKTAKSVKADKARELIFGYTIFNDMTARDTQSVEMSVGLGPAKAKDFDTGNVMGPCLVTADEISDPYSLKMEVFVNGMLRGSGNSREMYHSFETTLERVSDHETVHAGEFIASGTVGDGAGVESNTYLEHGDLIEMTVEKIGTLRNRAIRL